MVYQRRYINFSRSLAKLLNKEELYRGDTIHPTLSLHQYSKTGFTCDFLFVGRIKKANTTRKMEGAFKVSIGLGPYSIITFLLLGST